MKRPYLLLLAPAVLGILIAVLPLILGSGTLYYRDVTGLHLALKATQAQALARGELPQVDLMRAGEPMSGNANGLPFYPTNLLYLIGDFFWAFNAHFWLHWLLTVFAFAWLARAAGLRPAGAAAAAVFWSTSGYFLSQLNFYDLVAVTAVAPAFVASWLSASERPRLWPCSAGLLALLLLAGDPFSVVLALAAALVGLFFKTRSLPWRPLALSTLGGFALAAPGMVELVRIVPTSMRALTSQSVELSLSKSLFPAALLDFLVPWAQGDIRFGYRGEVPLMCCIFPGVLALAAALAAGRDQAAGGWPRRWSWALIGGGLFLGLGEYNPLMRLLYQTVPGFSQLRFPSKYSFLWAVGLALLAGIGFERFLAEEKIRRRLAALLAGFTVFYLLLLGLVPFLHGPGWQRAFGLVALDDSFLPAEKLRLARILLPLVLASFLLWLAALLAKRALALSAALLLAVGAITQLDLLEQLYGIDSVAAYKEAPAALAQLPADALVYHRSSTSVSEAAPIAGDLPDPSVLFVRCAAAELTPAFGALWQRRYLLSQTADYLDTRQGYLLTLEFHPAKDREVIPVLLALGVDRWLASRPIETDAAFRVELLGRYPNACQRELFVYRLRDAVPGPFLLVGNLRHAGDAGAGYRLLASGAIDAATTAVVFGSGEDRSGRPNGVVRVIDNSDDRFKLEVDSPAGGMLVARRAFLPLYRATVDGQPAPLQTVNLLHLGLELPAGRHQVEVAADRRPLQLAFAVSGLTAVVLLVLFLRTKKGGSEDPPLAAQGAVPAAKAAPLH